MLELWQSRFELLATCLGSAVTARSFSKAIAIPEIFLPQMMVQQRQELPMIYETSMQCDYDHLYRQIGPRRGGSFGRRSDKIASPLRLTNAALIRKLFQVLPNVVVHFLESRPSRKASEKIDDVSVANKIGP